MGKDVAVAHLVETYKDRYDIRRYSFGDALKADFHDRLLDPMHEYWQTVGHSKGNKSYLELPHPRDYSTSYSEKLAWTEEHKFELGNHLQVYATDYVRGKDIFYWVRNLRERLEAEKPQVALLSDVRFFTEFFYVKAFKGFTVKVTREGFAGLTDGRSSDHPSETELSNAKWDFEISAADGDVESLKQDAVTVFESIVDYVKPVELEGVADVCVG